MEKVAVDYFSELFTTTSPDGFSEILEGITGQITDTDNILLTKPATEEEVRSALFLMHPEKAPGPDGMTALFFQRSWPIIKMDILRFINDFLASGCFDKRLNMTNICLIPKTERPTRMTELRPISLCNVGYKIISKVLCERLKKVLSQLISETQSAFVPGRLISDNILIAQEMFHGLRTNKSCKGKFMAVKTDMSKAYDRVEWQFVEATMRKMGVIEDFNTALLAKQLWRLLDNPESLFAKVFKGRYYRNSSPLDPIRSYSPSYGWQSMISARPLVHKGLIKKLVQDLLSQYGMIHGFLTLAREIARITGITIATGYRKDTCGWLFTKSGRYTVKSGYRVLQELADEDVIPVFGPDVRRLQAQSWKVKCTTKLQHFIWQIISGCLSVFWSILEHMGHEEHGGTWHMEAAQLDTQRKKGEAILKTSSTVHSTNRSSSSTRPAKLQLDRAGSQSQTRKMLLPP
ncbi:unnamed protein product [Microthlaspi erraticum]|uniref:Reverse transcriptase domain-containing protein n=1 Tax=Microthlaspi erraticum TaxID=1685480 RepID=A0A6D2JL87_9BRAS|nr:unnamed protein product [Microthlaspi erraticum]